MHMFPRIPLLPVLFGLLLMSASSFSQPGPKVGLVLSGGGAKGYAHIGALKVLEEAGIRIDYIGGTSAGAMVGGLYAAGWPAWALDSIIRETDMTALLQDVAPRTTRSYNEKENGEHYAFSLNLQEFQIHAPDAITEGQYVYDFFSRLTIPVHHIRNFNDLPIPFLCVATDLERGEQVILREGFLPDAIRISSALPILLAPVYHNGCLLTDGGIVNNFPAKEVREMGADILIGITVEGAPYKAEELEQMDKMLSQIASFQQNKMSIAQLGHCDYLIRPELEGYGTTDFGQADTLLLRGEQAARAMWDTLIAIARMQQGGPPLPIVRPIPVLPDSVDIASVELNKPVTFSRDYILGQFEDPIPGRIAYDNFFNGLQSLKATGRLKFIQYRFDGEGQEKNLWLHPIEQKGYDKRLKAGIHYDDVYRASFLLNATFENALLANGHASLDVILLDRFRYTFHYLLDNGRQPSPGFTSRLHFNEFDFRLPEPVQLDSLLSLSHIRVNFSDFSNQFYLRLLTGLSREAGLGGEIKFFNARSDQLSGEQARRAFILEKAFYFTGQAYWKEDHLDDRHFPTKGTRWSFFAKGTYPLSPLMQEGAREGWSFIADFNWEGAFALNPKLAFCLEGQAGWTWGDPPAPYLFFIGGYNKNLINHFKSFPGLPFAAEGGSRLLKGQAMFRFQLWKNQFVSAGAVAALLDDYLIGDPDHFRPFYSGFLRYSFASPIGPVELTQAFSKSNIGIFYINLGYWF